MYNLWSKLLFEPISFRSQGRKLARHPKRRNWLKGVNDFILRAIEKAIHTRGSRPWIDKPTSYIDSIERPVLQNVSISMAISRLISLSCGRSCALADDVNCPHRNTPPRSSSLSLSLSLSFHSLPYFPFHFPLITSSRWRRDYSTNYKRLRERASLVVPLWSPRWLWINDKASNSSNHAIHLFQIFLTGV